MSLLDALRRLLRGHDESQERADARTRAAIKRADVAMREARDVGARARSVIEDARRADAAAARRRR